jgi:hypothetical protein
VVPVSVNGFCDAEATLRIALTGTNTVLVAWPAPSTGFNLQQNAGIETMNWTSVTNTVNVVAAKSK